MSRNKAGGTKQYTVFIRDVNRQALRQSAGLVCGRASGIRACRARAEYVHIVGNEALACGARDMATVWRQTRHRISFTATRHPCSSSRETEESGFVRQEVGRSLDFVDVEQSIL